MKKNMIYNLLIFFLYVLLYIWYLFAVKQGGMSDLGVFVTIIYMIIPFLSVVGGIIQRIFIKEMLIFILINYVLNYLLLYLIIDNIGGVFIISLIYAVITIILSYTTRSVMLLLQKRK